LAQDGDLTTDVNAQLVHFPDDTTHLFVSCGGNDALAVIHVLDYQVDSIGDALDELHEIREVFRENYRKMLDALLERSRNLTVCTIYNAIPQISKRDLTALAFFNEIILEEASAKELAVIDLRNLCKEELDYSRISYIEPSGAGARKIAKAIHHIVEQHDHASDGGRFYHYYR